MQSPSSKPRMFCFEFFHFSSYAPSFQKPFPLGFRDAKGFILIYGKCEGENPIKANGKMNVIDGGFSKACQYATGIARFRLIYNSYGMKLVAHKHFDSKAEVLSTGTEEYLGVGDYFLSALFLRFSNILFST
ncbi:fructose-bisphosphatase class III [Bacillus velezensis]|nr:fructose-bisphosphatase class III [Bacillus velezensis]WPF79100.1 fructose-bisphosphatase class III [Bacillus velezensis]